MSQSSNPSDAPTNPSTTPLTSHLANEEPGTGEPNDEHALEGLAVAYQADDRRHGRAADGSTRPWVMLNMVTSLDGAIEVEGTSGGLGGPADRRIFAGLREIADIIVVAAGTARAENYGPPVASAQARERRRTAGRPERPGLAVVTRSLDIDPDGRLFSDPTFRPTIITTEDAPAERRNALAAAGATIITAGASDVDLAQAIRLLATDEVPAPVVLAEGGPTLNGALVAADLLDELCWTVAPMLTGGAAKRMTVGPGCHPARSMCLDRAVPVGDYLFCRYVRNVETS